MTNKIILITNSVLNFRNFNFEFNVFVLAETFNQINQIVLKHVMCFKNM